MAVAHRAEGNAGRGGVLASIAAVVLLAVAAVTRPRARPAGAVPRSSTPLVEAGPQTAKRGWVGRIDLFQQRRRGLSFLVGVLRKFSDDGAGRHAALIAYYGFFSVFPALLALVTVLGFLLEDNPGMRADIADSALGQFPIVGDEIASSVADPLAGNPLALAIGLGGALWAGMGMVHTCQDAMNAVWDIERARYPSFIGKRVRSLIMLVVMGVLIIGSTSMTQLVNVVAPGMLAAAGLIVLSVALNLAVFMVAYRVLTVADVSWRTALPGAGFAAVAYTALQHVGGLYVRRTLDGASNTYGTFAVVIGLLSWIFLIAQMFMFGAEINVVAERRWWPRSLFGDPATRADRRSQAAQAAAQRMHDRMNIAVTFDRTEPETSAPGEPVTAEPR